MSLKRPGIYFLFGFISIVLGLAVTSSTSQINVTGTWDLRVETQEGIATPSITLRQNGEKITGTYSGEMGKVALDGTLKEDNIQFVVRLKFQDIPFVITYSGRVKGDTMQGTARFSDSVSGKWTGMRRR